MAASAPSSVANKTLYFGYGSNLWKTQMRKRCPSSTHLGIARLDGYRWIINERGYANVVQVPASTTSPGADGAVVWGLVYSLSGEDERKLDRNEGVPYAYTKEIMGVNFWPARDGGQKPDVSGKGERREMLVYIDRVRTGPDVPKEEYVYRMNQGIQDAMVEGVPTEYVENVMRKFISKGRPGDGDEDHVGVKELAKKQAEEFEEEE